MAASQGRMSMYFFVFMPCCQTFQDMMRLLCIVLLICRGQGNFCQPRFQHDCVGNSHSLMQRSGNANPFHTVNVGAHATPVFVDWDADGDVDLVVGSEAGEFRYFERVSASQVEERTGGANPFEGIVAAFAGSYSAPAFVDWDGDGDLDVVVGSLDGHVRYFEHIGSGNQTGLLLEHNSNTSNSDTNPFLSIDVGNNAAPVFEDWDGDGDADLVVGNHDGELRYFERTGAMTLVERSGEANPFVGIDVGDMATPAFKDFDADGHAELVVGNQAGQFRYFEHVGTRLLERGGSDNPFFGLTVTSYSAASIEDWDGDGDVDLVVGNGDGHVWFFDRIIIGALEERIGSDNPFRGISVGDMAIPAFLDWDGDGDMDLVVGNQNGELAYFEQTVFATFVEHKGIANPFRGINGSQYVKPAFTDWDGDLDLDLVLGQQDSKLRYFERTGAGALVERFANANPFNDLDVGNMAAPVFEDWDNDGDVDLLVGDLDGKLRYFERTGPENLTEHTGLLNPFANIDVVMGAYPAFVDWEADVKKELVVGNSHGQVQYFEREEDTTQVVLFSGTPNPFLGVNEGGQYQYSSPAFVDLDGDGDMDLVVGTSNGKLLYFMNGCDLNPICSDHGRCNTHTGNCTCVPGYVDELGCSGCVGGYGGVLDSSLTCVSCPVGSSSASGASCTLCAEGHYAPALSLSCSACPAGHSAPRGSADCSPCSAGDFSEAGGSCTRCALGHISVEGSSFCSTCPAGQVPTADQSMCNSCPLGEIAAPGAPSCSVCTSGYVPSDFRSSCLICISGSFAPSGSLVCSDCPPGRYGRDSGMAHCLDCPPGKFTDKARQTTCTTCPTGKVSEPGSSLCAECAPGKYGLPPVRPDTTTMTTTTATATLAGGRRLDVSSEEMNVSSEEVNVSLSSTAFSSTSSTTTSIVLWEPPLCMGCPKGRYSIQSGAPSISACIWCAVGKYNPNTSSSTSEDCQSCPLGSTTKSPGSTTSADCIRPQSQHNHTCTSGRKCEVSGVVGVGLSDVHVAAIMHPDCGGQFVLGVPQNALSMVASDNGQTYSWVNSLEEPFIPVGGKYAICWCPGLHTPCRQPANFAFTLGSLTVLGPTRPDAIFTCTRGKPCRDLGPLEGKGLSSLDSLLVQDVCGGNTLVLSAGNHNGTVREVDLSPASLLLGFGSEVLTLEPKDAYKLCWCGAASGSCRVGDHVVHAAQLKVTGPSDGHYISCYKGQHCQLDGITGVGIQAGDRIAVASSICGSGPFLEGVPGQQIAQIALASSGRFDFLPGGQEYLSSVPGNYHLCFCRPEGDSPCTEPAEFRAHVGMLACKGPFLQTSSECTVGQPCRISGVNGMGLVNGDELMILGSCTAPHNSSHFGLPSEPAVGTATGTTFTFGSLQVNVTAPYTYPLCWRPKTAAGTSKPFQVEIGRVTVVCPAGYNNVSVPVPIMRNGTAAISYMASCARCAWGYICNGKDPKMACPHSTQTTRGPYGNTSADCMCRAGYLFDGQTCKACSPGKYKVDISNSDVCVASCPAGTTSARGATALSSCYCEPGTVNIHESEGKFNCIAPNSSTSFENASAANVAVTRGSLGLRLDDRLTGAQWDEVLLIAREAIALALGVERSQVSITNADDLKKDAIGARRLVEGASNLRPLWYHTCWLASTSIFRYQVCHQGEHISGHVTLNVPEVTDSIRALLAGIVTVCGVAETTPATTAVSALNCPIGSAFPLGIAACSSLDCQCSVGYGYWKSLDGCVACPNGKYKDTIEHTDCLSCPPLNNVGDILPSELPGGVLPSLTSAFSGADLLNGSHAGALQFKHLSCLCPAGWKEAASKTPFACEPCGHNYTCGAGKQSPRPCPQSSFTLTKVGSTISDCRCHAGLYLDHYTGYSNSGSNLAICKQCPEGTFKDSNLLVDCLACPTGKFSDSRGQLTCSDCPIGQIANTTGLSVCYRCPAGYVAQEGSSCVGCADGTFADEGARCSQCPPFAPLLGSDGSEICSLTILAAIIIAVVATLLILIFCCCCCFRYRRYEAQKQLGAVKGEKDTDKLRHSVRQAEQARVKHPKLMDCKRQLAIQEAKYTDIEAFIQIVEEGHVKMIRGSWLVKQESLTRFKRQQDLPQEAFWTGQDLRRLHRSIAIVAVSHSWLHPVHPDPRAERLHVLRYALKLRLKVRGQGQIEDIALFFDYMCVAQDREKGSKHNPVSGDERTAEEKHSFKIALSSVHIPFAHEGVEVWLLTWVPEEWQFVGRGWPIGKKREDRGWPCFEKSIASLIKETTKLVEVTPESLDCTTWSDVYARGMVRRPAPVTPENFKRMILNKSFANSTDSDLVIARYEETFNDVVAKAVNLRFVGLHWNDTHAGELARLLPFCLCLQWLFVSNNEITMQGADCLVRAAGECRQLQGLDLSGNRILTRDEIGDLTDIWEAAGKDRHQLHLKGVHRDAGRQDDGAGVLLDMSMTPSASHTSHTVRLPMTLERTGSKESNPTRKKSSSSWPARSEADQPDSPIRTVKSVTFAGKDEVQHFRNSLDSDGFLERTPETQGSSSASGSSPAPKPMIAPVAQKLQKSSAPSKPAARLTGQTPQVVAAPDFSSAGGPAVVALPSTTTPEQMRKESSNKSKTFALPMPPPSPAESLSQPERSPEPTPQGSPMTPTPSQEDSPGAYKMVDSSMVTAGPARNSGSIGNLDTGTIVVVLEVVVMKEEDRVRARIREPAGWISLRCLGKEQNKYQWAVKQDTRESLAELEAQKRNALLANDTARAQSITAEIEALEAMEPQASRHPPPLPPPSNPPSEYTAHDVSSMGNDGGDSPMEEQVSKTNTGKTPPLQKDKE